MVRFTLRLSEVQMRVLKELAKREGISVSAFVRRALDKELAAAEVRERAMSMAGCVRSGTGDLAARHDDYLEEVYSE